MKILVICALVLGLEMVFAYTPLVSIKAHFTSEVDKCVVFKIKEALKLACEINIQGINPSNVGVEWKKDRKLVQNLPIYKNITMSSEEYTYTLKIGEGSANDVGDWSCHVFVSGNEEHSALIHVAATNLAVKIKRDDLNVVEGEKLRIECRVLGIPLPTISWRIESSNYNGTFDKSDKRVQIQQYKDSSGKIVKNGVLVINQVNKGDRGFYYCIASNICLKRNQKVMIRVTEKYAALWPFLGICIEVIVLCAIIIICEKKTKTELEEISDVAPGPDPKRY